MMYLSPSAFYRVTTIFLCFALLSFQGYGQKKFYATTQTNQVNGLCVGCGVTSPNNPVDSSTLSDYSTFVITAGLLGASVEQRLIFPAASKTGCDSLVVAIGSGNTLLSASLFGGVTIETYNGNTANNDAQTVSSGILRLLDCNTRAEVLLKPAKQFDRVKITLSSSLLGLLNAFRVYYAYKKNSVPSPDYTAPEGVSCGGPFIVVKNHQSGINYNVKVAYSAFFNPVFDTSYTVVNKDTVPLPFFDRFAGAQGDIYIQAVNSVTGCTSDTVHHSYFAGSSSSLPNVDADSVHICKGDSVTLHATQVINNPLYSLVWYKVPTGGTLLFIGAFYKVSPDTTTTYYVTGRASCEFPVRRAVKVQVTPRTPPVLANDVLHLIVNAYDTIRAIAPAGATFRWYSAATGGSLLFTGSNFPVHPVTTDTLYYYVESIVNGCVSSSRTKATVIVQSGYRISSHNNEMIRELRLYPNPAKGQVWFKDIPHINGSRITISDLQGKKVLQGILKTNTLLLPATLHTGTYIVQLYTPAGENYTVKMMVNKE